MSENVNRCVRSLLCCSGLALSYVWMFMMDNSMFANSVLTPVPAIPSRLIGSIVAIMLAFSWKMIHPSGNRMLPLLVLAMCGSAYTMLAYGSNAADASDGAVWLAAFLRSGFTVGSLVLWSDFLGELPLFQALVLVGFTFALAPILDVCALLLPQGAFFGITLMLPGVSAGCLACAYARMADGGSILPLQVNSTSVLVQEFTRVARPHGGQTIRRSLFPWHLALLIAAYSFVSGMMNYGSTLEVRVISFGVAGAIVLVFAFVLAYARAMSIYSLMNASLPVMLFGLLLASLMGSSNSFVVQLCVNTGNALLTAFTLVVISDCAYRFGFSAVFSCGVLRAVLMGCTLLGIASRTFLLGEPVPGSSQSIVFYLVAFAIIATAALFWFRRPIAEVSDAETGVLGAADGPTVVPMVGAAPVSDGPLASREVSEAVLDREIMRYRDMVLARCDQISQENRLSGRESEVLICLARGMSAPRIAEELVISGNTVKTHITHIYRKLGIHSRDELKVLIGVE